MLKKLKAFILGVEVLWSFSFALSNQDLSNQDLINIYCNGQTPCYICSNGNEIRKCNLTCPHNGVLQNGKCILSPQITSTILKRQAFIYSCSIDGSCNIGSNGFSLFCERTREHPPNIFGTFCKAYNTLDRRYYLCRVLSHRGYTDCYAIQENHICPSGYTYNSNINRCEAEPKYICPLGSYRCYNANSITIQEEDTPEGAYDKQNNGQITQQGCIGNIYIFNGHDYRCRPPGIETGFSDCCKKHWTWFGLGRCSERERILADLRNWGQLDGKCHYIGSYCSVKVLGVCLQRKKTFCCFSSPLARIIQEQGRRQLGISWGDPKHPNCRGFTPEEFQRIDFSKIDFSEWINYEVQQNIVPRINTNLQNALSNLQSAVQTSVGGQ